MSGVLDVVSKLPYSRHGYIYWHWQPNLIVVTTICLSQFLGSTRITRWKECQRLGASANGPQRTLPPFDIYTAKQANDNARKPTTRLNTTTTENLQPTGKDLERTDRSIRSIPPNNQHHCYLIGHGSSKTVHNQVAHIRQPSAQGVSSKLLL